MEFSPESRDRLQTSIYELSRKVNYLFTKTTNNVDLSAIEKQIQEILQLLDSLDLDTITKLINELKQENVALTSQILALKVNVDKNTNEIQRISESLEKLNQLLGELDIETLTSIIQFISDNQDILIEIIKMYKLLKDEGITNELILFYITEYPMIQKMVTTFKNNPVDLSELASQMRYMKDAMQIESLKNTYFDMINNTNPTIPQSLLEFTSTAHPEMNQQYRSLPPIKDEITDLRYPLQACILIEINRNTVLSNNDNVLFNKTDGNITLTIQEQSNKISYALNVTGDIYQLELDQFKITGSQNFSYLPNYKYHFLIFTLNDILKKTYTLSVVTGTADLDSNEISVTDVLITKDFPPNHWILFTNNLMFQTTMYASYESTTFNDSYDIFKKMYISSVLENVAYQTEKNFNELYTNQITNNLYGQSTAISISKILSLIGTVPRLRDVEYTLNSDKVSSPSRAFLDNVTSWIDGQQVAIPTVYTGIGDDGTGLKREAYGKDCGKWNTLFEQNGKYYANLDRTLFERQRETFNLKQAYEDGSRTVKAWFEDVWENTKITKTNRTSVGIYDSNGKILVDNATDDEVEIAFSMNPNNVAPRVMLCRITALTNNVKSGSVGIKLDHAVTTDITTYMYIQPGNISSESSTTLDGTIEINGETKSLIFTPYTYLNSNNTTSFVYRAQVSKSLNQNGVFTTSGVYFLKNMSRTAYVATDKSLNPVMKKVVTEYYNGPITDTPNNNGHFMQSYNIETESSNGKFLTTKGTFSDAPEYGIYDNGYILNPIAVRPSMMSTDNMSDKPTYMCEWYAVPQRSQPGITNTLDVISEVFTKGGATGLQDSRTLRYNTNSQTWNWVFTNIQVGRLYGAATINPQSYFGYTSTTSNIITNFILKGQELVLPVEFDQTSIPDYILAIKNDVAYLAAYAEYLKALMDNLDERVTLVENTVEELITVVNDIISAITPKQRSFGGQILSFCGTAIGMFFPLTGLAISIVGQMYEGTVQLKQGNLITGIMDLATGALMSALGVRKFKQRMDKKYGTRDDLSNSGLPTYDELYGPPGYGSDNVRNNLSIGRYGESNLIKSGTLRNTVILSDDSSNVKLETWLYRTNLGWETGVRMEAKSTQSRQSRAIRVTETWESKKLINIIYDYVQNIYSDYDTTSSVLSDEIFQSDYGTKFTIEQFGKMLFAKTRVCIMEAEGFGFDSEVFCMFMYTLSQNMQRTNSTRICAGKSMQLKDRTVIPFRNRSMDSNIISNGIDIIDFELALAPTISSEIAQTKILDNIYDFITMPSQLISMSELKTK